VSPDERKRLGLGGCEFVLADGEQLVVAQGFELGLENIDNGHRMAESIEDFEVVTVFRAVAYVIFHRCRHVAAAQTGTRQINRQSNSAVERKFHALLDTQKLSCGKAATNKQCSSFFALLAFVHDFLSA